MTDDLTNDLRAMDQEYAQGLTDDELSDFVFDSVVEAADGCQIEPDGVCSHGHRSPLLVLGLL